MSDKSDKKDENPRVVTNEELKRVVSKACLVIAVDADDADFYVLKDTATAHPVGRVRYENMKTRLDIARLLSTLDPEDYEE